MEDPTTINRQAWDEHAAIHVAGNATYPVAEFKAGTADLKPNTPDDLGDVRGKHLLHLQCHFGMDSLMWGRQGAIVTGVDFSPVAIAEARRLSEETGLRATFIESDVCDLPESLAGQFDIALSYYGTIGWLGNLKGWARGIARSLKPGGYFYLADGHPVTIAMEVGKDDSMLRPTGAYFSDGRPVRFEGSGTYAVPLAETKHKIMFEWQHNLQDIIGAVIDSGLRLDFLHEFPFTFYEKYTRPERAIMRQDERGWWRLLQGDGMYPLMYSLRASKT